MPKPEIFAPFTRFRLIEVKEPIAKKKVEKDLYRTRSDILLTLLLGFLHVIDFGHYVIKKIRLRG